MTSETDTVLQNNATQDGNNSRSRKRLTPGKIVAITAGGLVGIFLLTVIIYLLYVICGYYRLDDNLPLDIENNNQTVVAADETLTIMTYNVGFGAYSPGLYVFYGYRLNEGRHKNTRQIRQSNF